MELITRVPEPAAEQQKRDAQQAFRIMSSGGVTLLPLSVSYAIFAHTALAVERIYSLKKRPQTKPNGVIGNWDIFTDVFEVSDRDRDLVRCLTLDHDLPLSIIGPYRADHDWLRTVQFGALRRSTKAGTMDLLMNAGPLHNELARLSLDAAQPLMGSSANISGSGSKFRFEDVQESLREGCDLALDYGTSRYINEWQMGSTIIELPSWRVLRWGGLFEQQAALVKKHFGIELPPRPASGSWTLV
ncbi:MAG: Sua5/YciO/YrdC/YwlC family protein [Betaproteobacteria bacterium]